MGEGILKASHLKLRVATQDFVEIEVGSRGMGG